MSSRFLGRVRQSRKRFEVQERISSNSRANDELKTTVSDLQYKSTKINPTFYGIVDSPRENVDNLIRGFVREDLKVSKNAIFLSSSTSK